MSSNELCEFDRGYLEGKRASQGDYDDGWQDGYQDGYTKGYESGFDDGEDSATENIACWCIRDKNNKCVHIGDLVHPKNWGPYDNTRVLALGDGDIWVAAGEGDVTNYRGYEVERVSRW